MADQRKKLQLSSTDNREVLIIIKTQTIRSVHVIKQQTECNIASIIHSGILLVNIY